MKMNSNERRALDNAIQNAIHNAESQLADLTPDPAVDSKKEVSEAQMNANRANAQHSTGPTSAAGLKKISQNALKTGLTGAQVLLPTDDAARYEAHVRDYQNEFQPVGPEETHLLQSIIDTRWRLARIPGLESALLDLARRNMVTEQPAMANNPPLVLEMQARLLLDRDLRNLHLQENRLVRRREREMKELREMQAARKAAKPAQAAEKKAAAAPQTENGFVFTPPNLDDFLAVLTPETRAQLLKEMAEFRAADAENQQAVA